jgi:hypothetical protein
MSDLVEAGPRSAGTLMRLAQQGDRVAFAELQRIGEAQGISFTEDWSSHVVLFRLMDRASSKNLLARAGVEDDLKATIRDLSEPNDGPIEKLVVGRAAVATVDARMADLEHFRAIEHYDDPRDAETFDRRRDRAQRRLLATLKTLAEVRRLNRPAVQVAQLNRVTMTGDGAVNVIKT